MPPLLSLRTWVSLMQPLKYSQLHPGTVKKLRIGYIFLRYWRLLSEDNCYIRLVCLRYKHQGEVSPLHFITHRRFLLVVRCSYSSIKLILGSHYSAHYVKAIRKVIEKRNPSKLKQYRSGRENLRIQRAPKCCFSISFYNFNIYLY